MEKTVSQPHMVEIKNMQTTIRMNSFLCKVLKCGIKVDILTLIFLFYPLTKCFHGLNLNRWTSILRDVTRSRGWTTLNNPSLATGWINERPQTRWRELMRCDLCKNRSTKVKPPGIINYYKSVEFQQWLISPKDLWQKIVNKCNMNNVCHISPNEQGGKLYSQGLFEVNRVLVCKHGHPVFRRRVPFVKFYV